MPEGTTERQLHYHLFGLIFAGQLTTDASLGFLVARLLGPDPVGDLVGETLRANPPAPYTLWRYTSADVEIAGVRIPARSPVLVDIQGIDTGGNTGPDLSFGAGPHFCVGARLDVPYGELRVSGIGGIQGRRLDALPVRLRG